MFIRPISRGLVASGCLLILACSPDSAAGPVEPAGALGPSEADLALLVSPVCGEETFRLLADQSIEVGTVTIANDEDNLYVIFETTNGWAMSETRVAVTTDPDDVPNVGRQVAPGKFPYGTTLDPPETLYLQTVPLSVLGGGTEAAVAAYANAERGESVEGAWVEGDQIRERGAWASYASYRLADCDAGGEVSQVIGPEGGIIDAGDATLVVPEGALETDVEITISPVSDGLPDAVLTGTAFDLRPDGLEFAVPVLLVISHDDTGLSPEEEAALRICVLQPDGTPTCIPSVVDPDLNTVEAEITHFSVYAVVSAEVLSGVELELIAQRFSSAGGELEHLLLVRNNGTTPLSTAGTVVTLTVEGPLTPVSSRGSGPCSTGMPTATSFQYTCSLGASDILPGNVGFVDVIHVIDAASEGETITAAARYSNSGLEIATEPLVTTVEPAVEADLAITLALDPEGPPVIGLATPFEIWVSLFNLGPDVAHDVEFRAVIDGPVTVRAEALDPDCTLNDLVSPVEVVCSRGVFEGYLDPGAPADLWYLPLEGFDLGLASVTATISSGEAIDGIAENNDDTIVISIE